MASATTDAELKPVLHVDQEMKHPVGDRHGGGLHTPSGHLSQSLVTPVRGSAHQEATTYARKQA